MSDRLSIELPSAVAAPARLGLPVGQATAMLCQLAALHLSARLYALHQRKATIGAELGLARHALQLARRGEEQECRACAAEALRLSEQTRTPRDAARSLAALGELELALGNAAKAAQHF